MYRIGIGFDAHRFSEDKKLILGGVLIPGHPGLEGHSDADVLLHAICDSLLGALGRNDIGHYFPDSDERYKEIASSTLLEHVKDIVMSDGFAVENIDTVIICEKPRLNTYIDEMKNSISGCLGIETDQLGLKATTTEGMGFTGREEGIAAKAIALIKQL